MPTYKNQERGTWYCKFNYVDWTGKRKQKKKEGFKTQREAKEYEREFIRKSQADCTMLFSSLIELYLEDCRSRIKPTTYFNKENIINTKILPYFKDTPLNSIDATSIRKWQNELISYKDYKGNGYSLTYLRTINGQMSAIFNFAKRYYKLPENPVTTCGSIGKARPKAMQFWTLEEFKRFTAAIEDKLMSKVMFELLFWTGMRSGELLALTLNDFDFTAKTVHICKNYARLNREDIILTPKTPKSIRYIAIPDFICDTVKDYVTHLYGYNSNERLFPVTKRYLQHEIIRGYNAAELKKIRVHDLRHSHASLLIEQGFSPLLISERLGHEDIQTTLRIYSHLYPNKHSEVADKLQELYK